MMLMSEICGWVFKKNVSGINRRIRDFSNSFVKNKVLTEGNL